MTTAPTDWPLPAAAWRRDLRQRLMQQLSNEPAGSPTPRHPDHCASDPRDTPGSAPTTPPTDDQPRLPHRRRGSRGQGNRQQLGEAAMKTGSRYVAFGVRSLSVATGLLVVCLAIE